MFKLFKDKLAGLLGKPKEKTEPSDKPKKEAKQTSKKPKNTVKAKPSKKEASSKKPTSKSTPSSQVKDTSLSQIDQEQVQDNKEYQVQDSTERKPSFFSKFVKKLNTKTLNQEQFDDFFNELEITLLENNVALEAVDKIREKLEKDLIGIEIKKDKIQEEITNSLKESILEILIEPPNLIEDIKKSLETYTIVFFGINGTGKTTSIAKLVHLLKKNNISVVLAAGDTFRAASIEQLETHAKKLKVPIIKHQYNSDPAAVGFDAVKYAEKNKIKVVLMDTAGRIHTASNLMKEMEKIIRITKPNLKLFIGESITGNDAIEQAKAFNESIGFDGIILSKADIDEKAGTILSVSQVTNKPIYFLGTGQEYKDLEVFKKSTVLKNLGLE